MNLQPLIDHFSNYLSLSEVEINELKERLIEKNIKRRHFLLQAGDICKHYTFIVNGCTRMYKIDDKGQEHNLQFAIESEWISDIGSFHSEQPSELYIEAMEHTTCFQISKPDLLFLYTYHPKFDRNFRVIIEDEYIKLQKRVLHNISSTAEERYLDFVKNNAELFNRISNVQIASFLGVTPEFLSKIRKNINTNATQP